MPADLRNTRRKGEEPRRFPLRFRYVVLLTLLSMFYSMYAIHHDLPPWSWYEHWRHRHDKVVKHRPSFKKVERYSPEHRYRPAASPIIKKVQKDGRVLHHGQYH